MNNQRLEYLTPKPQIDKWFVITALSTVLYLIFAMVYVVAGQVNADEGWYLYASKLVYMGKIPYQDFAFTQMPLLPYVYAIPQTIFPPSLYLGRILIAIIATANFGIGIIIARKHAGRKSGSVAAILGATFSYGIYFSVIIKTYALLALLFSLTFVALSFKSRNYLNYVWAVGLAICAALVRLSAVFFAVPVVLYSYWATPRKKENQLMLFFGLIPILALLSFILPNVEAAQWNLLTHHISQWEGATFIEKIREILRYRIVTIFFGFGPYILLFAVVMIQVLWRHYFKMCNICDSQKRSLMWVFAGSLGAFSASHLLSGGWHLKYLVPGMVAFFSNTRYLRDERI